ncbi:MAG: hypothetical protein IH997_05145, partial [Proteobacteria bacterium]|nr:hypothetical protein [Pseudomonadota bacterium]
ITNGGAVISGTPVQTVLGSATIKWTQAAFIFDGPVVASDSFVLTLDGAVADGGSPYTVTGATDVAELTEKLADAIAAGAVTTDREFAPLVSGTTVTFKTPWPVDDFGVDILPDAGDLYAIAPVNPNVRVSEDVQVDTLNIFHGDSPSDDFGVLTENRLIGLGMGGDTIISGLIIPGGVTFANLEVINIELGSGNDHFTIESTHEGSTTVNTGAGRDVVNVRTTAGHTTIITGDGRDVVNVGSGVVSAALGADASTPERAALTTDRSRGLDEITGLLTIAAGDDRIRGAATSVGAATLDDFNAEFQTALPGAAVLDLIKLTVDILSQVDVGTLTIERDGFGVPTGLLVFSPNAEFDDFDVFAFQFGLSSTLGSKASYLVVIDAGDLDAVGARTDDFVIDVTDADTRALYLVDLTGLTVEIVAGPGAGQTRTIVSNTATSFTVDTPWDAGNLPAVDSEYVISGLEGFGDIVNLDDSDDANDNLGTLTQTTLTGLDMPTVPEVQTIFVQAASGTFRLRTEGFGTASGLPDTATDQITRGDGFAEVTLDFALSADQVRDRLIDLYGFSDILVSETRTIVDVTFIVRFVDLQAGIDFAQLEWDNDRSDLVANPNASANVETATVRDGRTAPIAEVQTVTVQAASGPFKLRTDGFGSENLADSTNVIGQPKGV